MHEDSEGGIGVPDPITKQKSVVPLDPMDQHFKGEKLECNVGTVAVHVQEKSETKI